MSWGCLLWVTLDVFGSSRARQFARGGLVIVDMMNSFVSLHFKLGFDEGFDGGRGLIVGLDNADGFAVMEWSEGSFRLFIYQHDRCLRNFIHN